MKQLIQLCRSNTHNCGLFIDKALVKHIHSHCKSCKSCSLTYTALEHPEFAILNCELNILHIVEMMLKVFLNLIQLFVNLWHSILQRGHILVLVVLCSVVERVRGSDTCYNILSLRIDEPLSVELVLTCCRVS